MKIPLGPVRDTLPRRLTWILRRDMPIEVAIRNGNKGPRDAFEAWRGHSYDLVWFRSTAIYHWLGRPNLGPTVVDIDDLEDEKERQRALLWCGGGPSVGSLRVRDARRRWSRPASTPETGAGSSAAAAASVDRVVLASDAEVDLLGVNNCDVLFNTYDQPDHPAGRVLPQQPPTILFQGTFDYGPNVDGARWLATEIAPKIRSYLPGSKVRLVGKTVASVEALADPPEITVVGRVPRMEPELAAADLVAVPLRIGSGTRLKILEAFAHRIPVVSTRIGADGLAVDDGVHLLLADDPDSFARACARVVEDLELRYGLVDAAERLFREHYESKAARDRVREIVASAMGRGT